MTELAFLRVVALKGRADHDLISVASGLAPEQVEAHAARAAEAGQVKETPAGLRITPDGRRRVDVLLAEERASLDAGAVTALYEEFSDINDRAKQIFTAWQLLDDGQPNDHSDGAYDARVLSRLDEIHAGVVPLIERLVPLAPRARQYGSRLTAAQAKYASGDHAYVTRPIIDSYHTVWFELHEDFISWAGLTRAEEAAAGRAH